LKHKILGKAAPIPFYLFVQTFCGNTVESCKVIIQHDSLAADQKDGLLYLFDLDRKSHYYPSIGRSLFRMQENMGTPLTVKTPGKVIVFLTEWEGVKSALDPSESLK